MAISGLTVTIDFKARKHASAIIWLGHMAIQLGADVDRTTQWVVRHAFTLTVE